MIPLLPLVFGPLGLFLASSSVISGILRARKEHRNIRFLEDIVAPGTAGALASPFVLALTPSVVGSFIATVFLGSLSSSAFASASGAMVSFLSANLATTFSSVLKTDTVTNFMIYIGVFIVILIAAITLLTLIIYNLFKEKFTNNEKEKQVIKK